MGLNVSHNCWDGAYSRFHRFRKALARAAGIPNLDLMEGFYHYVEDLYHFKQWNESEDLSQQKIAELFSDFPIKWTMLNHDPLHEFLYHSDCDGHIDWWDALKIAKRLREVCRKLEVEFRPAARKFAKGLELAHSKREKVRFG
jgi:hypothetical protein